MDVKPEATKDVLSRRDAINCYILQLSNIREFGRIGFPVHGFSPAKDSGRTNTSEYGRSNALPPLDEAFHGAEKRMGADLLPGDDPAILPRTTLLQLLTKPLKLVV
jgi:hypothetical protein